MRKKQLIKELIALFIFIALTAAFILTATRVTTPKRHDYGSTWGQYLAEPQNSIDILFFGSSIAYCDVVPGILWEETGVTSYVMAGPEQTIPFSYYYLLEASKTQSPKLVCLEVTGMFFKRYQDYTQINVGYMPFGKNRLNATLKASEKDKQEGLFFPLSFYHSRWSSLDSEDWRIALRGYETDDLAGYTYTGNGSAINGVTLRGEEFDAENYAENLDYLKKLAAFCSERGTKLLFFVAPTCWRLSDEHLQMLRSDLSSIGGAQYIDFNDDGLEPYDLEKDFYDSLHFDPSGAEKFSKRLAERLTELYALSPTEGADSELWSRRSSRFHELSQG